LNQQPSKKIKNLTSLVILAYIAFIALGMPDGLGGVAWPSIRSDFSVPLDSLGILIIASTVGYVSSSFLSGMLTKKMGVGPLLTLSCFLTGSALIGNTLVPSWWMMVLLGVLSGLGAGGIDAGLNTYATLHFGEGLMQWLHASYGLGVTLGPFIMTTVLTTGHSWRLGHRIVGGFQFVLSLAFLLTISLWNNHHQEVTQPEVETPTVPQATLKESLRKPAVWLSALLFFLYVGGEITLSSWTYSFLTEARGIPTQTAGFLTGGFWAMFTIGRLAAGFLTHRLGSRKIIFSGIVLALLGTALLWWNPFEFANVIAVVLIGLAIAPIFPALMSGTNQRVGDAYTANTIGFQMAMTGLGGAAVPSLVGVLAKHTSLEVVPICLTVVFAILLLAYSLIQPKTKTENILQSEEDK
jgi:fucose permease